MGHGNFGSEDEDAFCKEASLKFETRCDFIPSRTVCVEEDGRLTGSVGPLGIWKHWTLDTGARLELASAVAPGQRSY